MTVIDEMDRQPETGAGTDLAGVVGADWIAPRATAESSDAGVIGTCHPGHAAHRSVRAGFAAERAAKHGSAWA
jgi:ABC-type sugar transport system substrate-binding protein